MILVHNKIIDTVFAQNQPKKQVLSFFILCNILTGNSLHFWDRLYLYGTAAGIGISNNITVNSTDTVNDEYVYLGGNNTSGTVSFTGTVTNTINDGGAITNAMRLNAESGGTVDFSGLFTNSGTKDIEKIGAGTITFSNASNNFGSNDLYISNGTLNIDNSGSLGTLGDIFVGDTSGSNSATLEIGTAGVSISDAINIQSGSSGTMSLGTSNSSGIATFSGTVTLNQDITLTSIAGGTSLFTGDITDNALTNVNVNIDAGGGIVKFGTTAKTYAGGTSTSTTLNSGELLLGSADLIPDASNITFSSGTLDLAGFNETVAVVDWTATSYLDFGSTTGSNTFTFSDDDNTGVVGTLLVTNWEGSATDHFTTTSALTTSFLDNIKFQGFGTGAQKSGNDIIPSVSASDFFVWDNGGGDTLWDTNTDWTGENSVADNTSPGLGADNYNIKFDAAGTGDVLLDANTTFNTLIFTSSAVSSFTLKNDMGANYTFTVDGILPVIQQNSAVNHTFTDNTSNTLGIVLTADVLFSGTGSGSIVIGSTISSTGAITK